MRYTYSRSFVIWHVINNCVYKIAKERTDMRLLNKAPLFISHLTLNWIRITKIEQKEKWLSNILVYSKNELY